VKICTENAAARISGDASEESCWFTWLIGKQCYQESTRFVHPRLRRSAAQSSGNMKV
jgi:hypothetical protein